MQFIDLAAQQARIKPHIDRRIQDVLSHGRFIAGPEVAELEAQLAAFCGAKHCISCANGTDALQLALMAFEIRTGDAVFVPSFTFAATAEVVPCMGATPVFVDIDPATFNMDPESLARAILEAQAAGLRPAALIAVDMFGLPADYEALQNIADDHDLRMIADSAQSFGSRSNGRAVGTLGDITTTSFFPSKPLGCYGDGGAIFTNADDRAALLRSYCVHGKGAEKYDNVRVGMNSRLDTLQAGILIEKLAIFEDELAARQAVAGRYTQAMPGAFAPPQVADGLTSAWAQYTIRTTSEAERNRVREVLAARSVPTAVYYPKPLHQQIAFDRFPRDPSGLSHSEAASSTVLSLPMHPYLSADDQAEILTALALAAQPEVSA